jgi:mono/diheme cytochrome c family protein
MKTGLRAIVAAGIVTSFAAAVSAGGWAIVVVERLPDRFVAGTPQTLTFSVLQHGHTPVPNLTPRVVATSGSSAVEVTASAASGPGRYVATLTVPRVGDWQIAIDPAFVGARLTLAPIAAVAEASAPAPQLSDVARGHRLFLAKGCVTCHQHAGAGGMNRSLPMGPPLTRAYDPAYVARVLANPYTASMRWEGSTFRMPRVDLDSNEIAALVAFVNATSAPGAGQ